MTTTPTTVSLPLGPGRWVVDTNHSSIGFTIRHLGVSKVRGRFTRFDAEVVVGETLDTTTVNATVDVSSIDTATNTVVATVGVGANPIDVSITPDGAWAYVTNSGSNSVSVINTSTNAVTATATVGVNPVNAAIF